MIDLLGVFLLFLVECGVSLLTSFISFLEICQWNALLEIRKEIKFIYAQEVSIKNVSQFLCVSN